MKFGFLGAGIWYGIARQYSLTNFVKERKAQQAEKHREELIEEAKIVYDTVKMKELAQIAKKDGSKSY